MSAAKAWPIFRVQVYGYELHAEHFTAATKSAANWAAFSAWREFRQGWSFHDWLVEASISRLTPSEVERLLRLGDGYQYVRSAYGVSPKIGGVYALRNEGPNSGREVVVDWPGLHTSMIRCHYLGERRPMIVHPLNIVERAPHG